MVLLRWGKWEPQAALFLVGLLSCVFEVLKKYGKSTGTGTGTEDGKYFKIKYGYGDGYELILDPEVRKESG